MNNLFYMLLGAEIARPKETEADRAMREASMINIDRYNRENAQPIEDYIVAEECKDNTKLGLKIALVACVIAVITFCTLFI